MPDEYAIQPPKHYPIIPKPRDDRRFSLNLTLDVADVLERHGYARPEGNDWVDLQRALHRFLYGRRRR